MSSALFTPVVNSHVVHNCTQVPTVLHSLVGALFTVTREWQSGVRSQIGPLAG